MAKCGILISGIKRGGTVMFWIKKEPEKPNYAKIVAITLGIIAAVAAVGYAAYLYCKKKGICCYLCKCDKKACDEPEEEFDELDEDDIDGADLDVEVEPSPAE